LRDGGRPVHVRGHEEGRLTILAQMQGKFGGHGRLAGALQTHQHDERRASAPQVERGRLTQERNEFLANDLDDRLRRRQRLRHLRADGALPHFLGKVAHDLVVDVRLEQGQAHFAQGLGNVGIAQASLAGEALKTLLQFLGERVKHRGDPIL